MSSKKDIFSVSKAEESSGFLVWQMHNLWQRAIKKVLKKYDLTHTQFVLLATTVWLNQHTDNDITQISIAKQAQTDVMMTSNVLRTLERKSLIERTPHPVDTRAKLIQPTPIGIELAQKVIPEVEAFDRQFFNRLDNRKGFNADLLRLLEWEEK